MAKPAPINKFVVLTHVLYDDDYVPEVEKRTLDELRAIIHGCADEPGTHFIVSVVNNLPLKPELAKLIEQIPKERVHMPSKAGNWHNYLGDDPQLQKKIADIGLSSQIKIESYGQFVDMCAINNTKQVVDFVAKHAKVDGITILGGIWDEDAINKVVFGVKKMDNREQHYADRPHDVAYSQSLGAVQKKMEPHADKVVHAWPRKYKLKA